MPISVRTGRRQVSYQKINESAVFVLSVLVPTNQKGRLKTGNPHFQTTFSCFTPYQASIFCAIKALFSMKARRGSTSSPIRVTNTAGGTAILPASAEPPGPRRTVPVPYRDPDSPKAAPLSSIISIHRRRGTKIPAFPQKDRLDRVLPLVVLRGGGRRGQPP